MNVDLPGLSELGTEVKKPKIDLNKEEDFGKAKLIAPRPKRNGPLFYLFAFYLYYVLYCFITEAIFNVSLLWNVDGGRCRTVGNVDKALLSLAIM